MYIHVYSGGAWIRVVMWCTSNEVRVWHVEGACMCDMTSFQGVDVTRPCVWLDSGLYVWHDSFICVTWLMHMCDMSHLFVLHTHMHACTLAHTYTHTNSLSHTHIHRTPSTSHEAEKSSFRTQSRAQVSAMRMHSILQYRSIMYILQTPLKLCDTFSHPTSIQYIFTPYINTIHSHTLNWSIMNAFTSLIHCRILF